MSSTSRLVGCPAPCQRRSSSWPSGQRLGVVYAARVAGSVPLDVAPFGVALPGYELLVRPDELPSLYHEYVAGARLVDQVTVDDAETGDELPRFAFVAVGQGGGWPFLVVVFRYRPAGGSRSCGVALLPEQRRLF
jgi:hypothetical protein